MKTWRLALSFAVGMAIGLLLYPALESSPTSVRAARPTERTPSPVPSKIAPASSGEEPPSGEEADSGEEQTRLEAQLDALRATHESLDDRAREAERTVKKLERRIRVLEQELAWARGQEQEYIRTYPDDDIKEVIRTRERAFLDFGIELDVRETHEVLLLYRRLNQARVEAREEAAGDQRLRMRLTDEAKREFTRAAEVVLPPEKVRRIKERWDYLCSS